MNLGGGGASVAGPRRPQARALLSKAKEGFAQALPTLIGPRLPREAGRAAAPKQVERFESEGGNPTAVAVEDTESPAAQKDVDDDVFEQLHDGSVVIAAITSCTNTSNPSVMMAAGLLAKKAVEKGLRRKPWVKTSLAPGSRVVTEYYGKAGLLPYLEQLGFNVVGYGCTTCIGNSGPLPQDVSYAINEKA